MGTRREFLGTIAAGGIALYASPSLAGGYEEMELAPKSRMGVASTAMSMHLNGLGVATPMREDPVRYIEYLRSLGAGGVQHAIRTDLPRVRAKLEELGMFYEGEAALPYHPDDDLAGFEQSMLQARELGAHCVRAVSRQPPGGNRRYETFATLEDYRAWEAQANAVIEKVMPIVDRIGVGLALENHKDRTAEEHVAVLSRYSSEHLGALIDPGNNMSLMEDAAETVGKLGPYAMACSMKDMGVAPYADGFLLSEVPFGTGINDQKALFQTMRDHNPRINLVEEIITRDPLEIPVLTESYWRTLPGMDAGRLARTLAGVRARAQALPVVTGLSPQQKLQAEEDNNRQTLAWAVAQFGAA
ncbi:sugar phosphate isomerase/epimerase family protein [Brevundimonas sp. SL161]|uniref:sugar phosphate isomerase/epimerase family protein n=1 Tax=Brevundimonas sp. SL161 TaxID=2804613 RepID=UPI003CEA9FE2